MLPRALCLKLFYEAKKGKIPDLLGSWEIVIMLNTLLFLPWTGSLGSILIGNRERLNHMNSLAISCSDGCGQNRYLNYSACSVKLISSTADQEQQDFRSYLSSWAACNYTFSELPFVLYCAQEREGLGGLGILKLCVGSPVSVQRSFSAQCWYWNPASFSSLFQLCWYAQSHRSRHDGKYKAQEKEQKSERPLCLQWWAFVVTASDTILSFPNWNYWQEL